MISLKYLTVFVVSTCIYCALASTVPTDPPEEAQYGRREISECYNNPCVRRYCDEAEPDPDCKFEGTCERGDLCEEGYLIDRDERCVSVDQCTNPVVCKDDKEFTFCINGGCDMLNCTQLTETPLCIDLIAGGCDPGCVCKNNKLLTENGTCVPANECPANEVCPNPHEIFDPCPSSFPSQYCPGIVDSSECPPQPKLGDLDCEPACRCEEGYYRTQNLECVLLKECPPSD